MSQDTSGEITFRETSQGRATPRHTASKHPEASLACAPLRIHIARPTTPPCAVGDAALDLADQPPVLRVRHPGAMHRSPAQASSTKLNPPAMQLTLPLDEWFTKRAPKGDRSLSASDGQAYLEQYKKAASDLDRFVHSEVTKSAIATDGGYLTDHGTDHIRIVIRRATALIHDTECDLTLYEVYILLMAIHFHDVGNAFGRKGHEAAARRAMKFLGDCAGRDSIEKNEILKIARAHGGQVNGDKDTIARLDSKTSILGRAIRPQLLAGIVRFADELADERTRASRFKLATQTVPNEALIFHEYAFALHSVEVDHRASTIHLEYEFPAATALLQYQIDGQSLYLLDYIFQRTLKMHLEAVYCLRFLRRCIDLDTVQVRIQVFGEDSIEPIEQIGYRLAQSGYPTTVGDIHQACSTLVGPDGAKITGQWIAERISKRSD